jgi:hypothetical protein
MGIWALFYAPAERWPGKPAGKQLRHPTGCAWTGIIWPKLSRISLPVTVITRLPPGRFRNPTDAFQSGTLGGSFKRGVARPLFEAVG